MMLLDVCKAVLLWKLDAGSSLERSEVQVMQKIAKIMQNGRPGVPLGARWGSKNNANKHERSCFACVFQVSILERLLGHIFSEIPSEWHGLNRVWTAQARADRTLTVFGKSRPRDLFLHDVDVVSGARRSHLGDFLRKKLSSVAGGFGLVFEVMETVGNRRKLSELTGTQPRLKSRQRSKSI